MSSSGRYESPSKRRVRALFFAIEPNFVERSCSGRLATRKIKGRWNSCIPLRMMSKIEH